MVADGRALGAFIARTRSFALLTGAGVSTASGIPDYRDREGSWKHSQPIQYGEFVSSETSRRRYWSRSFAGWQRFSAARPNAAHYLLARLQREGKVDTVITQNVDGLHGEAGSRDVIDLHGCLGKVRCLDCGAITRRTDFQLALETANPGWRTAVRGYRADGDAELGEGMEIGFSVPGCARCAGTVKPDVVMFGEAVPKERVQAAMDAVDRAEALLVVGSSLMVYSGYRFARRASDTGKPIVIVNQGRTRADDLATLKLEADCAMAISAALQHIAAGC